MHLGEEKIGGQVHSVDTDPSSRMGPASASLSPPLPERLASGPGFSSAPVAPGPGHSRLGGKGPAPAMAPQARRGLPRSCGSRGPQSPLPAGTV